MIFFVYDSPNILHLVLGFCGFQWCGFHLCEFSKNSPNIQLMSFIDLTEVSNFGWRWYCLLSWDENLSVGTVADNWWKRNLIWGLVQCFTRKIRLKSWPNPGFRSIDVIFWKRHTFSIFFLVGIVSFLISRKVASSNTSSLEAHAGIFRLLMKGIFQCLLHVKDTGIFEPYLLWPFDKKLIS